MIVTFDAGETLVELDPEFLAKRLRERGVVADVDRLAAAKPAAWRHHDELVAAGARHPWHALVTHLLEGAGLTDVAPLVGWLWDEQPRANLWRKPIPGMVALARELAAEGVAVGVLSNSEGRIAELLAEVGIADPFAAIVDSGVVGVAKPDRRIFDHARAALGGGDAIHIGDSWAADVVGAIEAGWKAVYYGPRVGTQTHAGVVTARDPEAARAAIKRWL